VGSPRAGCSSAEPTQQTGSSSSGCGATSRAPPTPSIIGSGDHIFAPVARYLRSHDKRVEVVARAGTLSAELYRAADAVHIMPSSVPFDSREMASPN